VPTWTRELRSIDALGPGVERYAAATRALRGRISGTDLVTFAGQEHFAHLMVPGQVAKVIADVAS
jgi:hypothetical protein